ncbi:phosphoribosylglycinamide formyltransferase [Methanohalobium evestigatum Z-7303]|uniref:phosphoribosylglycinamide formyltransferase 1 n=1 Tax=Methanohalobium evestigatum (strain ATCC BAA-1072 / DSM 3721 / NBRC 107634 / OCM 161 / Z-7303) TaxID=644295 RepID=D7E5X5_METEZ|nr:phosphoribosylglycinamide formyltransferase [Methanohalobium evestigatum]ADI72997.1 phosphoribosylglycinamide formyltransferase [Methanohalobium evestigatum Z-7303]
MVVNIAVLASGRGTNLQSIINNVENGYIHDANIKAVISDVRDAHALERAKKYGISAVFIDPSEFSDKSEYEKELIKKLEEFNTDLVLLAGFMRILGNKFVRFYKHRILNIHPSLLPAFKGLRAQKQALDYGVKVSGCTVHYVTEDMDSGPIILQECVPVYEDDTEETLENRILQEEHEIYPEAVKLWVEGKV